MYGAGQSASPSRWQVCPSNDALSCAAEFLVDVDVDLAPLSFSSARARAPFKKMHPVCFKESYKAVQFKATSLLIGFGIFHSRMQHGAHVGQRDTARKKSAQTPTTRPTFVRIRHRGPRSVSCITAITAFEIGSKIVIHPNFPIFQARVARVSCGHGKKMS